MLASRVIPSVGGVPGRNEDSAVERTRESAIVVVDSVTALDAAARGRVVVCGSHGGHFSGAYAASVGVLGIVLNDAAVGKDRAGIAGLDLLDGRGIPAAAVDHLTADIGDGESTLRHGVLSHVNEAAREIRCAPGMSVHEAGEAMRRSIRVPDISVSPFFENRHLLREGKPRVWALDSASLATSDDVGDVLLTGSHGELLGGRREAALAVHALAAVFNDAGRSARELPPGRLAALDEREIAAATVDAQSARIGDARSTYFDGTLSHVNRTAAFWGARAGMTARAFTDLALARAPTFAETAGA